LVPAERFHLERVKTMTRALRLTATMFAFALLVSLVACSKKTQQQEIIGDLSPEMQATAQRPDDVNTNFAYMTNTDMRGFWDDLGRVFYTDHPTKLSPYPIAEMSGSPK
jgi:hypothetical protein